MEGFIFALLACGQSSAGRNHAVIAQNWPFAIDDPYIFIGRKKRLHRLTRASAIGAIIVEKLHYGDIPLGVAKIGGVGVGFEFQTHGIGSRGRPFLLALLQNSDRLHDDFWIFQNRLKRQLFDLILRHALGGGTLCKACKGKGQKDCAHSLNSYRSGSVWQMPVPKTSGQSAATGKNSHTAPLPRAVEPQ